MLKNTFNYFAKDVKRVCYPFSLDGIKETLLGSERRYGGGNFPGLGEMLFSPLARGALVADRTVTLAGIFAATAGFMFSPAIVAVPAIIGLSVAAKAAGYAVAYGVDKGFKAIEKKLQPPQRPSL